MDAIRKRDALLKFHFGIQSPQELTDDEYMEQWEMLQFALSFEAARYSGDDKGVTL